jgi:putative flippase GtrA
VSVAGRVVTTPPLTRLLTRFALSGAAVAAVHLAIVTVLTLAGLPIQIALVIGYVAAISLHFTLNRRFVFATDAGYHHRLSAQGARYLVVAVSSYAITAACLATLPGALGVPELAVFFAVTAVLAVVSFVTLRAWVFRPAAGGRP